MMPVLWSEREKLSAAMAVAGILKAEDGREFYVERWSPSIIVEGVVRVTADMIVYLPEEKDANLPTA